MVQTLIKELQKIFQTSDVTISNSNMKDPIAVSNFYSKVGFQALFRVTIAVTNIGSQKYYL